MICSFHNSGSPGPGTCPRCHDESNPIGLQRTRGRRAPASPREPVEIRYTPDCRSEGQKEAAARDRWPLQFR
jgi:hypothetical protein